MLSHNFPDFDTLFGQASGKATNSLDDVLSDMDRALEMTLGSYLNVADAYVDFMMSQPFYNTVVNFFEKLLSELDLTGLLSTIQPVSLLILDINMPIKNGFKTTHAVKGLFENINRNSRDESNGPQNSTNRSSMPHDI